MTQTPRLTSKPALGDDKTRAPRSIAWQRRRRFPNGFPAAARRRRLPLIPLQAPSAAPNWMTSRDDKDGHRKRRPPEPDHAARKPARPDPIENFKLKHILVGRPIKATRPLHFRFTATVQLGRTLTPFLPFLVI